MTAAPNAKVIAAVQELQDERDELLELLGIVADSHTETGRDGLAMLLLPADVLDEIRRHLT